MIATLPEWLHDFLDTALTLSMIAWRVALVFALIVLVPAVRRFLDRTTVNR